MGIAIDFNKAKKQIMKQYDSNNEIKAINADLEDSKKFVAALELVVEYLKYFNINELVIDDDNVFLTEIDNHIIPGLAIQTYNNKIIYLAINTENETISPTILTEDDFKQLEDDFENIQDEINRLRNNDDDNDDNFKQLDDNDDNFKQLDDNGDDYNGDDDNGDDDNDSIS